VAVAAVTAAVLGTQVAAVAADAVTVAVYALGVCCSGCSSSCYRVLAAVAAAMCA
jgi:hypothetical protein